MPSSILRRTSTPQRSSGLWVWLCRAELPRSDARGPVGRGPTFESVRLGRSVQRVHIRRFVSATFVGRANGIFVWALASALDGLSPLSLHAKAVRLRFSDQTTRTTHHAHGARHAPHRRANTSASCLLSSMHSRRRAAHSTFVDSFRINWPQPAVLSAGAQLGRARGDARRSCPTSSRRPDRRQPPPSTADSRRHRMKAADSGTAHALKRMASADPPRIGRSVEVH